MKLGAHSVSAEGIDAAKIAHKRVAVVTAEFYDEIARMLESGARRALDECKIPAESRGFFRVPGAFELPPAAQRVIASGRYDAVIALGAVVRGETPHFDFVAGECARGLMDVQLKTGVPIGFGVLTTETLRQAEERADPARGDKGYVAALAALTLLAIG